MKVNVKWLFDDRKKKNKRNEKTSMFHMFVYVSKCAKCKISECKQYFKHFGRAFYFIYKYFRFTELFLVFFRMFAYTQQHTLKKFSFSFSLYQAASAPISRIQICLSILMLFTIFKPFATAFPRRCVCVYLVLSVFAFTVWVYIEYCICVILCAVKFHPPKKVKEKKWITQNTLTYKLWQILLCVLTDKVNFQNPIVVSQNVDICQIECFNA